MRFQGARMCEDYPPIRTGNTGTLSQVHHFHVSKSCKHETRVSKLALLTFQDDIDIESRRLSGGVSLWLPKKPFVEYRCFS